MPRLTDREFGDIVVRKHAATRRITARIGPNGQLRITIPTSSPLAAVRLFLKTSRRQLRQLLSDHQHSHAYTKDQPIGKSHHLLIRPGNTPVRVSLSKQQIIAHVPDEAAITTPPVQQLIRSKVLAALRREAKHYLPRRVRYLAQQHGFQYQTVAVNHASSRWGSCSSRGTISLNIALMTLPFELIDYVVVHELAHTRHMDHSRQFWQVVGRIDPQYRAHRDALAEHTPYI
mgnify:FL=1